LLIDASFKKRKRVLLFKEFYQKGFARSTMDDKPDNYYKILLKYKFNWFRIILIIHYLMATRSYL